MVKRAGPTVVSLFSGAGGMDRGLEEAGFHHLGVVEINPSAAATLRLNRPEWGMLGSGDVIQVAQTLTPGDLGMKPGQLDLLAGGPPCQPFSLAAQWAASGRMGMQDRRADTVHATMTLVRRFLPRAVLMENVLGFVRGKHSALGFLQEELDRISRETGVQYHLHWRLLNAADFGVPQNRRRAIMVAIRDDVEWDWPHPTHIDTPLTAWDALADLEEIEKPRPSGRWTPLLPSIPEGWNYQWLTERGGGDEIFGYRTKYWNFLLKLAKSAPSWTLAASPGPSTGPFHWENRPLTNREQMRLQSFPDDWKLSGDYRTRTHQVGNATPPVLAEVLGRQIASVLGYPSSSSSTLVRLPAAAPPPPPLAPRPLPSDFASQRGRKAPHLGTGKGPAPRVAAVV